MKRTYKTAVLLVMVVMLISSLGYTYAQENVNVTKYQYAIENLKAGIKSDNEGLRRSSIYLAGKYRLANVVETLVNQLKDEDNPSNRILIALVLYRIGDKEGMNAVENLYKTDKNQKVRKMAHEIINAYTITNDYSGVITSNNF